MRRLLLLGSLLAATTNCSLFTSCFVRGTLVHTPTGKVPIEALRVGDEVLTFRSDHAIATRRVTATLRAVVERVRVITLRGSATKITTTDEHPFWEAEERAWKPARELVRGSTLARLSAKDPRRVIPDVIEHIEDVYAPRTEVFNLTVDGEHTYFAEGIAVHNKSIACTDCVNSPPAEPATTPPNDRIAIQIVEPTEDVWLDTALATGALDDVPINGDSLIERGIKTASQFRSVALREGESFESRGEVQLSDKPPPAIAPVAFMQIAEARYVVSGAGRRATVRINPRAMPNGVRDPNEPKFLLEGPNIHATFMHPTSSAPLPIVGDYDSCTENQLGSGHRLVMPLAGIAPGTTFEALPGSLDRSIGRVCQFVRPTGPTANNRDGINLCVPPELWFPKREDVVVRALDSGNPNVEGVEITGSIGTITIARHFVRGSLAADVASASKTIQVSAGTELTVEERVSSLKAEERCYRQRRSAGFDECGTVEAPLKLRSNLVANGGAVELDKVLNDQGSNAQLWIVGASHLLAGRKGCTAPDVATAIVETITRK